MRVAEEASREQVESSFTAPLRRVLALDASVQAVAFVDSAGECVDYCSRVPPHEAKVVGAVSEILLRFLRPACERMEAGHAWLLHLRCTHGTLLVRPVDADYLVGLLATDDIDPDAVDEPLAIACAELREAAALAPPHWEPYAPVTEVSLRPARGWPHAPASFRTAEARFEVESVLGRWVEEHPLANLELECFRIRTIAGHELTLMRDSRTGRWTRS